MSITTAMVNINALQADGKTDTLLRTEPVTEKSEAFGWYIQRMDGQPPFRDPLRHEGRPRRPAAREPPKVHFMRSELTALLSSGVAWRRSSKTYGNRHETPILSTVQRD